jgi:hypothetical protein
VVGRNKLRAIGRCWHFGGCRSGERKTEREDERACGKRAAKFQHRDVKMTRRDLFDKRPLTPGVAELPLGALGAVDRDLAEVGADGPEPDAIKMKRENGPRRASSGSGGEGATLAALKLAQRGP